MQRFIREVNTTNRACVLWDLAEDADYIIQVQSIGLYGESQASKRVHFRTLKETDRLPSNSSNQGEAAPPARRCCWRGRSRGVRGTGQGSSSRRGRRCPEQQMLGTYRVITGSRVVQAAVVSTVATIMSPGPGLQPSYPRPWHPVQLSRLWPGQLRWLLSCCHRKQILSRLLDLPVCRLPEDKWQRPVVSFPAHVHVVPSGLGVCLHARP